MQKKLFEKTVIGVDVLEILDDDSPFCDSTITDSGVMNNEHYQIYICKTGITREEKIEYVCKIRYGTLLDQNSRSFLFTRDTFSEFQEWFNSLSLCEIHNNLYSFKCSFCISEKVFDHKEGIDECSVCKEPLRFKLVRPLCHHFIHYKCMKRLLKKECPICRQSFRDFTNATDGTKDIIEIDPKLVFRENDTDDD